MGKPAKPTVERFTVITVEGAFWVKCAECPFAVRQDNMYPIDAVNCHYKINHMLVDMRK